MSQSPEQNTQNIVMQTLNPFAMPLKGTVLIEASAGTGKTYTISLLYLRLLLGIRDHDVFSAPLTVEQILVVTFTKAATEELRERIRLNIHELRVACIRFAADPTLTDSSRLSTLITLLDSHNQIHTAIERLLLAEQEMDKAAIYTIHGFCQRALSGLAIESGSPLEFTLQEHNYQLIEQACIDFWRKYCYRMPEYLHQKILSFYATPSDLKSAIGQYLEGELPVFSDEKCQEGSRIIKLAKMDELSEPIDKINYLVELVNDMLIAIAEFKPKWLAAIEDPDSILNRLLGDLSILNQRSYPAKKVLPVVSKITEWAKNSSAKLELPDNLAMFSQSQLDKSTTKNNTKPTMPLFNEIEALLQVVDDELLKSNFLKMAICEMRSLLSASKEKKGILTFNDLISRLDEAFRADEEHELVKTLQNEFPVALIDEFQDTDPAQYRIFSTLYQSNYHSQYESLLLLIGDPKQAIYGFRGADIHTYMQAKNEAESHYTLDTNYRSSPCVIESINQVFSYNDNPFMYEQIPFQPVKAAKVNESLGFIVEGETKPGLSIMRSEHNDVLSLVEYRQFMSDALAEKVANWMKLAQIDQAYFNTKSGRKRLQVEDIAVIVRSKSEASLIQNSLLDYGINSVYLSANESVFNTEIALDMIRLLKAAYEPQNERLIRESLGTILFQLTASQLYELQENEQLWETKLYQFQVYQQKWQQYGVMAFLRDVLIENKLSEKWYAAGLGERMLMDFMHLTELLQKAETEFESQHELIKWFSEQIEMPTVESQESQLRLESDKHVVKIVSIHKSKGLEYPIVLHPFALMYKAAKTPLDFMDEISNERVIDIAGIRKEDIKVQAEKARLSEDIRLTYVALTRAVYHCVIGFAHVMEKSNSKSTMTHKTSLGRLLLKPDEDSESVNFYTVITELAKHQLGQSNPIQIEVISTEEVNKSLIRVDDSNCVDEIYHAARFTRAVLDTWTMSSYSHLTAKRKPSSDSALEIMRDSKVQELLRINPVDTSDPQIESDQVRDPYHFPKGAFAGIFLHELLEHPERYLTHELSQRESNWRIALEKFAVHLNINPSADENNELSLWQQMLEQWLKSIYEYCLPVANVSLSDLEFTNQSRELHFHLNMQHPLNAKTLNSVIQKYDHLSARAGLLSFEEVQGMLQGFIDLVFEHEGKFYIIDYKSNHLGNDIESYSQTSMEDAMVAHRYDLQYQLYSLALHRYLNQRFTGYEYETHFGGVFYLFIRAIGSQNDVDFASNTSDLPYGVFYTKPSFDFVLALDKLF